METPVARFFHPLILMFTSLGKSELARQVQYLKAEKRNPPRKAPQAGGGPAGGGPGGPGGPGGGFHLIPRFAVEKMNLTADQQKQIAELEKETKAKLGKILTPEQQKIIEEAHPPRPGQGGPGERCDQGEGGVVVCAELTAPARRARGGSRGVYSTEANIAPFADTPRLPPWARNN